jgi:hypothetical protein
MRLGVSLVLVLLGAACGSTPGVAGPGDGGPLADGGAPGLDGGGTQDGGSAPDGGSSGSDGGAGAWRILPGQGLDVMAGASAVQLRRGQTRAQVRALVGDGTDAPVFAGPFDRLYTDGYVLFYANTDQSDDGASTPQPTFTDGDEVRYLTAVPGFPGRSPGGSAVGDPRSTWTAELGSPALTLVDLDNPGETRDYYFAQGAIVSYATSSSNTTAVTVSRAMRVPNETIELRNRRLGSVQADLGGNGSPAAVVTTQWGEADQIDDYTVLGFIPGSNYTYVGQGLLFVTQASLGSQTYRVQSIVFFDPYFGKTDFGGLGVRSTKSEFDAKLSSAACTPLTRNAFGASWTIYRLADGHCEIRLGVTFDGQNRARSLYLNFPNI